MTILQRLMRFVSVGAVSTVVEYAAVALFTHGLGWRVLLANPLAYLLSAIVNFIGSRHFTFAEAKDQAATTQAGRFAVVHSVALLLDFGIAALAERIGPLGGIAPQWIGKAIALPVIALWSFTLHRLWTFRRLS